MSVNFLYHSHENDASVVTWPIQKCGFLALIKAAQGFPARRTRVRRSLKPAENADQRQKDRF